jgi:hypothetical protein
MRLFTEEATTPELRTKERLIEYLEDAATPLVMPEESEYVSWDADRRERFDERRIDQLSCLRPLRTPSLVEVRRELEVVILNNRFKRGSRNALHLTGPTTTGKTTAIYEALGMALQRYKLDVPGYSARTRLPVAYVRVPFTGTGKSLIQRCAEFLGVPRSSTLTTESLQMRVFKAVEKLDTRVIALDDINRVKAHTTAGTQTVDLFKDFSDNLGVSIIYAGTGGELDPAQGGVFATGAGEQIAARALPISFSPFGYVEPEQQLRWNGIVRAAESQLPLFHHVPGTLDPAQLHRLTNGSISALFRTVTIAAQLKIFTAVGIPDDDGLSMDDVRRVPQDELNRQKSARLEALTSRRKRRTTKGQDHALG